MLSRKQVVETLQANRSEAVHLLDQLVRQLPDGIYLSSVRQTGAKVTVTGYAQSNARVSTLMRNIEASPWLTSPELVEIKPGSGPRCRRKQRPQDQCVHDELRHQARGTGRRQGGRRRRPRARAAKAKAAAPATERAA